MPRRPIPCSVCGAPRVPGRGSLAEGALTCRTCRRITRTGSAERLTECVRDGCTRPVHARSLCGAHYEHDRVGAPTPGHRLCADCGGTFQPRDRQQRFCSARCSNHYRDSRRQRAHRKHFDAVWARDEGICGICGTGVDPSLAFPHRMSATLDHITPRAHSGSDDPANLRIAHLTCNASRQDRVA